MSAANALKRLGLLLMILKRNHYPTKLELLEYFEERDLGMSERSFSRMLEHLRNDFDICISYHATHRGYYIDWNNSMDLYALEDLIELSQINQLIIEYLKKQSVHSEYIILDSRTELDGMESFVPLMKAINKKQEVAFKHFKYETEEESHQQIQPYFLKEFERRWYVVGKRVSDGARRVYGLDRISELEVLRQRFTKDDRFQLDQYTDSVGLKLIGDELHTIRLQFSRHIGHYIQSLPIHKSQTLIQKTATSMVFELTCRLTYELFNLIMKYGAEVKVLSPDSLADWVKEEHLKSIQLYDIN